MLEWRIKALESSWHSLTQLSLFFSLVTFTASLSPWLVPHHTIPKRPRAKVCSNFTSAGLPNESNSTFSVLWGALTYAFFMCHWRYAMTARKTPNSMPSNPPIVTATGKAMDPESSVQAQWHTDAHESQVVVIWWKRHLPSPVAVFKSGALSCHWLQSLGKAGYQRPTVCRLENSTFSSSTSACKSTPITIS